MILALLWLTISTPFVYASEQKQAQHNKIFASFDSTPEEESSNPFADTTEEKNPNSSSFSEEYLHEHDAHHHFSFVGSQNYKCEDSDTYTAFHGEVQVPPPNIA